LNPRDEPCVGYKCNLSLSQWHSYQQLDIFAIYIFANMASTTKHAKPLEQPDEYADAERNYQPKSLKFWSIILGMYLAIFLVALVSIA
jgi:hypothetical protein